MHRLSRSVALVAIAAAATGLAQPASAQDAERHAAFLPSSSETAELRTPAPTGASSSSAAQGPTLQSSTVAVRHQPSTETAAAASRHGTGQPEALMIVGGAAILVGILVGGGAGYAIAVGGAVVGLYGLYQYLQ